METAFRITTESLKKDQQAMVRICEEHGISRGALADAFCTSRNLVDQLMAGCNSTRLTTEHDLMLRSICVELGHYEFVERLLMGRAYVARRPRVRTNGSADDELLDGLQTLGQTRVEALRGNWRAIRDFGETVKEVGVRLVAESLEQMGVESPATAQSAPLFETT